MPKPVTNIADLSAKVLKGVQKAVNDLIEASAAKGEDVVIGDMDGSFKIIPAKDLLSPKGSEKDWFLLKIWD